MKKIFAGAVALVLLVAALYYFFAYTWTIGEPTAATVKYGDTGQILVLTPEQTQKLTEILKDTRPTLFYSEHVGINNEPVLISLTYPDNSCKTFSLWSFYTTLYEGNAENLTMASMLGNSIHFGGSVSDDLMPYLTEIRE